MGKVLKGYKIELDSKEKVEELLQEIYTEACNNIEEVQREINRLANSTSLNEESIDGRAKYSKAINDFINTKDKAISRKLEVAKLLTDVIKSNGTSQGGNSNDVPIDWTKIMDDVNDTIQSDKPNDVIEYKIR